LGFWPAYFTNGSVTIFFLLYTPPLSGPLGFFQTAGVAFLLVSVRWGIGKTENPFACIEKDFIRWMPTDQPYDQLSRTLHDSTRQIDKGKPNRFQSFAHPPLRPLEKSPIRP
jgi:hypothetical protein